MERLEEGEPIQGPVIVCSRLPVGAKMLLGSPSQQHRTKQPLDRINAYNLCCMCILCVYMRIYIQTCVSVCRCTGESFRCHICYPSLFLPAPRKNSWSLVSKSPQKWRRLGWCVGDMFVAYRSCLFLWGCCLVTRYRLILSSLARLKRYRACDATLTNRSLLLIAIMFVCTVFLALGVYDTWTMHSKCFF